MRQPPRRRTAGGWDFEAVLRRMVMIREILAIALIVSGLGLLGWVIAAPDRMLPGVPMAAES